jgi:hypothetical protein
MNTETTSRETEVVDNSATYVRKGTTQPYYTLAYGVEPKGDYDMAIAPMGGGFVKYVRSEDYEVQEYVSKQVNGWAHIDGDVMYECVCDPNNRWNGHAQPTFTRKTMERILEDMPEAMEYVLEPEDQYDDRPEIEVRTYFPVGNRTYELTIIMDNENQTGSTDGWVWDFLPREDILDRYPCDKLETIQEFCRLHDYPWIAYEKVDTEDNYMVYVFYEEQKDQWEDFIN